MKKTFLTILLTVTALTACHKQTFDERVEDEVIQFNEKQAPKRMDAYTTFDSMAYDRQALELSYYYTIDYDFNAQLFTDEEVWNEIWQEKRGEVQTQLREELLRNLQSSIQLKAYKEHGLTFHYTYYLKRTGETVVDCAFTPEDYR